MTKFLVLTVLACVILSGCVTQKKKDEDVTKVGKLLHNVTSKYNGYYNAELLLEKTLANIEESTRDNYTRQLDLFKYISNADTASIAGDLNTIIEKNTVAITLHRPADWTDDHYLMLGQAQFLKKDYEEAMLTFEYMVEEYDPAYLEKKEAEADAKAKKYKGKKKKSSKKKKKKKPVARSQQSKEEPKPEPVLTDKEKEKIKPDAYVLKHRPAHQEGQLWLAKSYLELEKYGDAERLLYELYRNPKTFKDVKAEVVTTMAYYEIAKRDAPLEAVKYLEEAIELTKKRTNRARMSFILAQIYEANDNDGKARDLYETVIKSNPPYEMIFNAKLNLVLNAHSNGVESDQSTLTALERMTRDYKNIDYHDQIYYAMGQIAIGSGDREGAIAFLKEAIANSTTNNVQRAEAYLQLANLYFEENEFVNAKSYFDSTIVDMPITDERYENVKAYADNLSAIAENITIIAYQDSLLAIAALSPQDKKKLANDILKEQRRQQILANLSDSNPNTTVANRGARGTLLNNSSFFAYDDKQVKKGSRDFRRMWGDRPLEDDWRRSARVSFGIDDDVTIDESGAPVERELTEDELNNVLAEVPSTPEQISAAETKIMNAMFDLGKAFRDKLEDNQSAIETLEGLLERFPDFENKKEVYYYLYLCHNSLENSTAAKIYYDKLIKEYPQSTFAQILTDPEYAKKALEKENQLRAHYDKAYALFQDGKIKEGCAMVDEATLLYGAENTLSAKFALLKALCEGKVNGKPAYIKALREVVAQYPDTEEKTKAEEMLRVLLGARADNGRAAANVDRGLNKNKVFKAEPDKLHYVIVIFKDQKMTLDDAKLKIAEFNKFHFKDDRLRISNLVLDPESKTPIIVIRRFVNQEKAMTYYNTTVDKASSFLGKKTDFEMYPVTQFNYREILRKRDLQDYDQFFKDNY